MILTEPLRATALTEAYDIDATLDGGGPTGQAGALRHGIARALIALDPELRPALKRLGFLTRDSREKESKKYGLQKARKAPQYSKRYRSSSPAFAALPLLALAGVRDKTTQERGGG